MDTIELLIEILISSFFLATFANLTLTKFVFKQDFGRIQNSLGLALLIGLGLSYALLVSQKMFTNLTDKGELFVLRSGKEHLFYNIMLVFPIIVLALNVTRTLRTKKIVAILSMLMFLPGLMEFFIIYTISDVTFMTMNSVYTDPMLLILVAGPIFYAIIILLVKLRVPTVSSSHQNVDRK
jgi:hypothetical protein